MKTLKSKCASVVVATLVTNSVTWSGDSLTDFVEDGLEAAVEAGKNQGNGKSQGNGKGQGLGQGNGNGQGLNNGQGQGLEKRFKSGDAAAVAELENLVTQSAAQKGVATAPGQYEGYSLRLAKTLAMLSAEQQARIFE